MLSTPIKLHSSRDGALPNGVNNKFLKCSFNSKDQTIEQYLNYYHVPTYQFSGGPASNALQEAQIYIVEQKDCSEAYKAQKSALIDSRMLCAAKTGKDSCQVDVYHTWKQILFFIQFENYTTSIIT